MANASRGPYYIEEREGHAYSSRYVICAPDYDNRIAVVSQNGAANGSKEVALANACLLGASWFMYKSLEVIKDIIGTDGSEEVIIRLIECALNKANGNE